VLLADASLAELLSALMGVACDLHKDDDYWIARRDNDVLDEVRQQLHDAYVEICCELDRRDEFAQALVSIGAGQG
jgi:hypothetical protein